MDNDPTYDDHFDESYDSGDMPTADLEDQAEAHARCLRYWQGQQDDVSRRFGAEITRMKERAQQATAKIAKRIAWHEAGLKMFYEARGEKRLTLANATLSSARGRHYIDVDDIDALTAWAAQEDHPEMLRVKTDADLRAIMEYIKTSGEEPAGCKLQRGEDAFRVKF